MGVLVWPNLLKKKRKDSSRSEEFCFGLESDLFVRNNN